MMITVMCKTVLVILDVMTAIVVILKKEVYQHLSIILVELVRKVLWWLQMQDRINQLQEICNSLYEEHGLTDEVLSLQVAINKLRHKHDLSDNTNRIHENYVQ